MQIIGGGARPPVPPPPYSYGPDVGELEAKTWSSLQLLTCQCRSLPTRTGSFGNKHSRLPALNFITDFKASTSAVVYMYLLQKTVW